MTNSVFRLCFGLVLFAGMAWAQRTVLSFNDDWKFARFGEQADGTVISEPEGQTESFDDVAWRSLRLPHDWGVESPFLMTVNGSQGRLPYFGIGWYRKHFTLNESDRGRCVFLDIDGAMSDSTVWLNGIRVGGRPYGYSSFRMDLTPHLHQPGEPNVLAIRLDNKRLSARWYPGGGLYRNVWLVKTAPVHVGHWGVVVRTKVLADNVAHVTANVTVDGHWTNASPIEVVGTLYELDADRNHATGRRVLTFNPVTVLPSGHTQVTLTTELPHVRLWDTDSPNLYRIDVTLRVGNQTLDV